MALKVIACIFAVIGALDRLFGNKLHLGVGFERAIKLMGASALAVVGMIVIAPVLAGLLRPLLSGGGLFDPSVVPAMLFANDMGGAVLGVELAKDAEVGMMNAMVVSSMMGCTVSYTIPVAIGLTESKLHRPLSLGILCGVVTIPIGCFVGGCVAGLPILAILIDILPIAALALVIVIALIKFPKASIKGFRVLGVIIQVMGTAGFVLGLMDYLLDFRPIKSIGSYTEAFDLVVYACTIMAGMLPFLQILSVILKKPFAKMGGWLHVNEKSMLGFVSSLATNMTTFESMDEMDEKGIMLNSAFAVSGAFVLADHLAYTMAFNASYALPVVLGKLSAGISAVVLCALLCPRFRRMLDNDATSAPALSENAEQ